MTEIQLFVIATIATALVYVVKVLAEKGGLTVPRGWLTVILFAVSLGLALAWQLPVFPMFPLFGGEVAEYAGVLVTYFIRCLEAISPLVAFATLIYNVLGKRVFEGIGARLKV